MDEMPAKIQPPEGIALRISKVDKKRIGCFSLIPITKGTEFGPYEGRIVYDKEDETVNPKFSWEVFDLKTFKYVHTVDATNPEDGNWMRYVCCARFFEEQNIVSTQNGPEVYYRALKDIEAGEELLTWFQPKKKKRKRSSVRNSIDSIDTSDVPDAKSAFLSSVSDSPQSHNKLKRRRKPKVIPDAYIGPLDWDDNKTVAKKDKDDVFEPLQPGQKRRRRKKLSSDTQSSDGSSLPEVKQVLEEEEDGVKPNVIKIEEKQFEKKAIDEEKPLKLSKQAESSGNSARKNSTSGDCKKESGQALSIAEINNSVEWEFPKPGEEYNFELKKHHVVTEKGKKLYKCDICLGLYKHMFSLKRHYLRNHVNYKYLSKSDMTNCLINLAQVKHLMQKKFPEEVQCNGNETKEITEHKIENTNDTEAGQVIKDVENDETRKENSDNKMYDETSQNCVQENEVSGHLLQTNSKSDENSICDREENFQISKSRVEETVSQVVDESSLQTVFSGESDGGVSSAPLENSDSVLDCLDEGSKCMKKDVKLNENENKGNITVEEKEKAMETNEQTCSNIAMPGLFRCYTCYLTFDNFEGIREHTQNHPEQTDGACFPCDLCSMRFNYKHNLVRHKKTHETEALEKNMSGEMNTTDGDRDKVSPKKHLLPIKNQSAQEQKPLLLPTVFRCGVCPQKFDNQSKVVKHVEEEHKTGSKFQCMYCGKDFQSMPNMKKHVRFHLGYRATCRICSEAFSNVGALRKHTRVSHPDIYKAKLIERLEKYGVLKGPDKNALSKEIIDKVNSDRKKLKETSEAIKPTESVEKEVKTDTCNKEIEEKEEIDHEINFTADEIDDGGSRFKFACTVCKKRFSSYINMCRHRRKVHSNENRNRTEQCLTFGRKPRNNPSPVLENPAEIAAFYANISHNIATNLNCYIDGKPESLKTFVDHIKVEGYTGNFGYSGVETDKPLDLTWEKYNFPHHYKPVETISFADVKKVLNIHNDFDSHCVSVDVRSEEGANKESKSQEDIQKETEDIEDTPENSDIAKSLKETKKETDRDIKDTVTEESIEDTEVREINTAWQPEEIKKSENNSESVESDTMGKTSHGLKALVSIGSVLSKKGASNASCERKMQEAGDLYKIKMADRLLNSTDSPAAKTFYQVKLGEYANFQDDLLSVDLDCSVAKVTQDMNESEHTRKVKCNEQSEQSRSHMYETSKLVKEAQCQLEALYESIENCEPVYTSSPQSLSVLCEKVLGLGLSAKENKTETGSSHNVKEVSQCKILASDSKELEMKSPLDNGPDYSDAPEESPFYNYETIEFGKNGRVEQICAICKRHFPDIDSLIRHHTKKHPATECSFLEVEQGNDIEDLHFSEPSYVGALAVTDPGLDSCSDLDAFKCTSCNASFKTVSKLHVHIVNCSLIDPIYGVQKTENSPTKTPLKKRLQKKIFNMFGNRNDVKTDLTFTHFKLSQPRNETQSPKRVFTGCRKRTSVILPDSPQKLVCEQKVSVPTVSGYNPQNHVRRRELTEILDTLTCEACGLKFKTIIILERHIKYCTKKEKFKSIQPMACPLMDESLEKIKNMCFYCTKNFTYTKSLLNHFQDFCPVKRAKLDRGELTEQDRTKEKEIIERIQKADEEKALKQKEMENRPKRNMTWQVGRKAKRKGHSWTNIKKRSHQKQPANETGNTEEPEDIEGFESSESDQDVDENTASESNSVIQKNSCEVKENLNDFSSNSNDTTERSKKLKENAVEEVCKNPESKKNSSDISSETVDGKKDSVVTVCVQESKNVALAIHGNVLTGDLTKAQMPQGIMTTSEMTKNESTDLSFTENDEAQSYPDINNTSLNCTARYNVNQVKALTKYRPIAPKPKSSSIIFQCVSKKLPISRHCPPEITKEYSKDNNGAVTSNKEVKSLPYSCVNSSMPSQTKEETTFQQAEQGLVSGKRKRARVGKVEEFLRNAFKRKRKKIDTDLEKLAQQGNSSYVTINPVNPVTENTDKSEGNGDDTLGKSEIRNDNLYINETEKNRIKDAESATRKSQEIYELGPCEKTDLVDTKSENELSTVTLDPSEKQHAAIITKRGRGRPRGSFSKKPVQSNINDQNVPKKRGRPRKFQLNEPCAKKNEPAQSESSLAGETVGEKMDTNENLVNGLQTNKCKGEIIEDKDAKHSVVEKESISGSNTAETNKMSNNKMKGEDKLNSFNDLNSGKTGYHENSVDKIIVGSDTKESHNHKAKQDFNGSDKSNYFNISLQKNTLKVDINNDCFESIEGNKELSINDIKSNCMLSDTASVKDIPVIGKTGKNLLVKKSLSDEDIDTGYLPTKNIENVNENQHQTSIIGESFDEVDGVFIATSSKEYENRKSFCVTKEQVQLSSEMFNDSAPKVFEMVSSLTQVTDSAENKSNGPVVKEEKDKLEEIEENCTVTGSVNEVEEMEGKDLTGGASFIEIKSEREIISVHEDEQFNDFNFDQCPEDEDNFDKGVSSNDKCYLENERDAEVSESNKTKYIDDDLKSDEIESKTYSENRECGSSESATTFEPVLSPSERVKTNRRKCKKDVDLTSPVWVKRTQLNKTKVDRKIEMCNESDNQFAQVSNEKDQKTSDKSSKSVGISESLVSDASKLKGAKRKGSEPDSFSSQTIKHSKQENVKGTVKKITKVKKA